MPRSARAMRGRGRPRKESRAAGDDTADEEAAGADTADGDTPPMTPRAPAGAH